MPLDQPGRISRLYFPGFDVFRGISICLLLLAHAPVPGSSLYSLRPLGALSVHIFLALSGFLITHRLLEEYDQKGSVSLAGFYKRRARRILPPAMLYLAVLTVLGPLLHRLPTSWAEITAGLCFYRNLFAAKLPEAWYTGHFWSLSLEEQFYLFWPALLIAAGARSRKAVALAVGIVVSTGVWRAIVLSARPDSNIYRPDLLADHLMWGCLLCLLWRRICTWIPAPVRRALGVAGMAIAVYLIYAQPPMWRFAFSASVGIGFVFSAAAMERHDGVWRYLQTLGKASYDCYLWQSLFLALPWPYAALPWPQRFPANCLFLAAATTASYRLTFPGYGGRPKPTIERNADCPVS